MKKLYVKAMPRMLPVIYAITLGLILSPCFCLAQTTVSDSSNAPETEWDHTYGAFMGYTIIQTSDKGYAIGGVHAIYQSAPRGPGSFENRTSYLIKTNASGTAEWNKTYNLGLGIDSIIQTEDGGYLFSGYSSYHEKKLWLTKTDSEGNVQWNNTYLEANYYGYSKVAKTKGGYFLIGFTQSGLLVNSTAIVIKIDNKGNLQWNKTYSKNGMFFDYIETNDQGFLLLGRNNNNGNTDIHTSMGGRTPWLVKIDTDGNVQWMKTYEDYKCEVIESVCLANDGGYLLVGKESSSGNTGSYFALLIKIDLRGNLQWIKKYDQIVEGADQIFLKITPTVDNCYFVGGVVKPSEYVLLIKIDTSGNILWQRVFTHYSTNSATNTFFSSLLKTEGNGLALVGTIGDFEENSAIWVVKLSPESGFSALTSQISLILAVTIIITLIAVIVIFKRKKNKHLQTKARGS